MTHPIHELNSFPRKLEIVENGNISLPTKLLLILTHSKSGNKNKQ
jgi:hypothetical protein